MNLNNTRAFSTLKRKRERLEGWIMERPNRTPSMRKIFRLFKPENISTGDWYYLKKNLPFSLIKYINHSIIVIL